MAPQGACEFLVRDVIAFYFARIGCARGFKTVPKDLDGAGALSRLGDVACDPLRFILCGADADSPDLTSGGKGPFAAPARRKKGHILDESCYK